MSASGPTYSAAFKTAAEADLTEARSWAAAVETTTAKMDALMDDLLGESSDDASALWLDGWSLVRRNVPLAAEWLTCIADIVSSSVNSGEFYVADADVAARRVLSMIDGVGAQMVVRAVPSEEAKHIARSYFTSELGVVGA